MVGKGVEQKDYAIWSVAKPLTLSPVLQPTNGKPEPQQPTNARREFSYRFSRPFTKFTA
jgi:hypothetical protein